MAKVASNSSECRESASQSSVELSDESEPLLSLLRPLVRARGEALESAAKADLLATIHDKIIPQLILAHAPDPVGTERCPNARLPPTQVEVAEFSRIAVREDLEGALLFVEDMADDGLSLDTILLDLVAPAARLLGDEWLDDRRNFTEVTFGLNTLHRVVHVLGPTATPTRSDRGSVVLVAAPAEQHTLGIFLLAECLRKEGWGVRADPDMPKTELLDIVRSEHVDMVGISVSNTDLVGPLTHLVSAIRNASMNDNMAVMIGGSISLAGDAEEIGATFCNDAREAVELLAHHVRKSPGA